MPNSTPTYWSVGSESLHTYARSIETLGGLLSVPPLRGGNITIPYMPGTRWVTKTPDERTLSLAMWIRGLSNSDGQGGYQLSKALFDENWNNIVRLLWTPGKQFPLTKRFYADGTIRAATAMAEYAGGLAPTMMGRSAGKAVVDLRLANPYFYEETVSFHNLTNGDQTITVRGNAPTLRVGITINGARTNTIIRNKTAGEVAHQVEYHESLGSGEVATLDCENYSAETSPASGPDYDSTVDVRHSGSPYWLMLYPGANTINLSSDSGVGTVTLAVTGAWV